MTTYYVNATTGSDANAGTSDGAALQSIDAVEKLKLHPGDSVLFARDTTYTGDLLVKYSGSIANPITFGAYGTGAAPVLGGGGTGISVSKEQNIVIQDVAIANTASNAVFGHGSANITMQNVQVVDTGTAAHSGAISFEGSSNITIRGSSFTGVTGDGIWIDASNGVVISQNKIDTVHGGTGDNIQVTGTDNVSILNNLLDMSEQTNSSKGNLVVNTSDGVVIEGNTMIGGSYGASVNSDNVTIAYNEVYGQSGYTWSFGIGIGEKWDVSNYDIYGNYVHDVRFGVAISGTGPTPVYRTDMEVHGNTFDNITGAALKVDRPASGDFSGNDIDANSPPLKISPDNVTAGTFTIGENGTYVSMAPHSLPDTAFAYMHTEVVHGNVLANDTSPSGTPLSLVEFDGHAVGDGLTVEGHYGSLSIEADGSYTYTVDEAMVQTITKGALDVFTYIDSDGEHFGASQLTVDVLPRMNIRPVAVNDSKAVDAEGLVTGNVLANDRDANLSQLYVRSTASTKVGDDPVHISGAYGTLTIAADGAYSYQVDAARLHDGQSPVSDSFLYKISDSGLQDTGSLTIHIDPLSLAMSGVVDFHM